MSARNRILKAFRKAARSIKDARPNGLVPFSTRKVIGLTLPEGFDRSRFNRLTSAPGPWLSEVLSLAKPVYAQMLVNRPGSPRGVYRHLKKKLRKGAL